MRNFLILYFILICFVILSKLNSFFINIAYIVLLIPLAFYDLKKLGFQNYGKGFMYGTGTSLVYLPFIINGFSINHFLQIPQVFAEEVFFRGFGLSSFDKMNVHLSNVLISILFTIPHVIINPSILSVLVFFPSIVFGYLFIYTRSIVAPVIFHWLSNVFFQVFLYKLLSKMAILSM